MAAEMTVGVPREVAQDRWTTLTCRPVLWQGRGDKPATYSALYFPNKRVKRLIEILTDLTVMVAQCDGDPAESVDEFVYAVLDEIERRIIDFAVGDGRSPETQA